MGHEADHSSSSSAEVKKEWSYTSNSIHVFMAWFLFKNQGQLYLFLSSEKAGR
jgi:hypothetical protein